MLLTPRLFRRAGAILAITTVTVLMGGPGYAAAASNDTFAGAVQIDTVPFTATQDTSGATTDADDTEANADCGAPALDASVWYSITPTASIDLLVDVSGSTYSAGVLVVTGAPGTFKIETCGPRAVAFAASAGVTYHLLIIDDQFDGAGNGGILNLVVEAAPPPPTVDVTVDPTAQFDPRTGSATVSGQISCIGEVSFTFIGVELQQPVGRGVVYGFGSTEVTCDGTFRPWSVEVMPVLGEKFAGGKAASVTFAISCGRVFCGIDFEQRTVQLSRR